MTTTTTFMTAGKARGVNACTNEHGVIAAVVIAQRGSLKRAVAAATKRSVVATDLLEFKAIVAEVLSPFASALLLDPQYGLEAVAHRAPDVGVLLAYETSGYDTAVKGRFPGLLPGWSVRRLVAAGAHGIKIVMYYDPDEQPSINDIKHAFIERVGAERRAEDVAFFYEPVTYADGIDSQSANYARLKPGKVRRAMAEFCRLEYGVDILKVEIPINPRYLKGAPGSRDAASVYDRTEAVEYCRVAVARAICLSQRQRERRGLPGDARASHGGKGAVQ